MEQLDGLPNGLAVTKDDVYMYVAAMQGGLLVYNI